MRIESLTCIVMLLGTLGCSESKLVEGAEDTGSDPTGEGSETPDELDADGDGYTAEFDCDDANPAINPGATEICNSLDDNCDLEIDEGLASDYYRDADADGFGSEDNHARSCTPLTGYTEAAGDCDDTDGAVNPGADEVCDEWGTDEDCNGLVNSEDPGVTGALTVYIDDDGDGFGSEAIESCGDLFSGVVENDSDCDDGDFDIHPDALEICEDGVDNNCDGEDRSCHVDPVGEIDLGTADATLYGDAEYDLAGGAVESAGDIDGDGIEDAIVGAIGAASYSSNEGMAYIVRGPLDGNMDLVDADAWFMGPYYSGFTGYSVTGGGDLNGDGVHDVAIGSPGEGTGGLHVLYGPLSGEIDGGSADEAYAGMGYGDYAGSAIDIVDDVDGDGSQDMIVGAYMFSGDYANQGAVYLMTAPGTASTNDLESNATTTFVGHMDGASLGYSATGVGDMDGDGLEDLALPIAADASLPEDPGVVYLVTGGAPTGVQYITDVASAALIGEQWQDFAGAGVSSAGDQNGDGYIDMAVGAPLNNDNGDGAGKTYIAFGPFSGDHELVSANVIIRGTDEADQFGWSIDQGDVTGWGYGDLVIGARSASPGGIASGAAYVVLGPMDEGDHEVEDIAQAVLAGEATLDQVAYQASFIGDQDGDGLDDVLVGAPLREVSGGMWTGVSYMVVGDRILYP